MKSESSAPKFRPISWPMLSRFGLLPAILLVAHPALAQGHGGGRSSRLPEPRNVKAAYAAGTRSRDGRPGPNYWENHARYRITLTVRPPNDTIRGSERIVYRNESPDALRMLVVKLFMNVHRPGAPRAVDVPGSYLTSGVHMDSFAVDGQARPWRTFLPTATWQPVRLARPLAPGDSVELAFRWHYRLASARRLDGAAKEGAVDSTTFYLAYFYPRVAVDDDYQGWDLAEYRLGAGREFYNDFNDYDVTIRVPAGYVVWGTGSLENADDVLQSGALARYRASFDSDSVVHVATPEQMAAGEITRGEDGGSDAWHFTARDVPDVAFGLSDHYDWDAASVVVDSASGHRASVQAAYADSAADFHRMVGFTRHAIDWFSRRWPGAAYPYPTMTAFQGGAGEEYPMMINDASNADPARTRIIAEHEIAHTYMPFYMGTDETRYGFMDEGWAVTLEHLIGSADVGKAKEAARFEKDRVSLWARGGVVLPGQKPSPAVDLPIVTPGDAMTAGGVDGLGLGVNEYGKAALGYLAVKDLLGDGSFKQCLQAYMARWHGKHPSPWDFFYTFDDVSGRDLDWFWRDWFFGSGHIDLAVTGVSKAGNGYDVTLRNVGGMDAPVDLILHLADGSERTVHETPAIWKKDGKRAVVHVASKVALTSVGLEHGIWMDADPSNDRWTR